MKKETKEKMENIIFRIRQFNSEMMQNLADEIEEIIESEAEQ